MLTPVPEADHIEKVREIAHLANRTDAEFYLNRLNQAEWDATLLDITEWGRVKNKHTIIRGDGVEIDKSVNRLDITNRVRGRFGLKELDAAGRVVNFYDFEAGEGTRSIEIVGGW